MLLLDVDRGRSSALHSQISDQIRGLVDDGTLSVGAALPSSRSLAKRLGVNRSTVCQAYQDLWALGYVDSRPGSYTRVRARAPLVAADTSRRSGSIDWDGALAPAAAAARQRMQTFAPEANGDDIVVSLSRLDLDPRLFPVDVFRRCLDRALRGEGAELLCYGDRQGHPGLRRQIAERARTHGMSVGPEQVLLTNGSQNAIDLVLRLLAVPGGRVAVEEPTYANLIPLLACHQVQPLGVPMTEEGLDLAALESVLATQRPAMLYTIPNFHNPTGITTSQSHREALLELCRRHRLPVVEDGFEEEMKYFGKVTLPLKSMDREQVVLYLGTFSKVLFPGVRVGWIIADARCIERLVALRRFAELSSSAVLQAGLAEMLSKGHYESHIRKMHRVFRRRMGATLRACREHLPGELVHWTEPAGGYLIWVRFLPADVDEGRFRQLCAQHGVSVSPGGYYFASRPPHVCFRISISMLDEHEACDGIARLGRALRELGQGGAR